MSEEETKTSCTASTNTASTMTLEKLTETMRELDQKNLSMVRSLVEGASGIQIIEDHTGMMVPPNGYVVVAGKKLYQALKGTP